jgi:cytidylate kinase
MSKGHVIGLASLPGAGKQGIAQGLLELGVEHLHIGTVVRATAKENGFVPKDDSREAYLPFWGEFAKKHGQEWLARLALDTAAKTGSTILLDGVRIPADAEVISRTDDGSMVWLEGDLGTLAQRVVGRNRIEDIGLSDRAAYYSRLANHVLYICDLASIRTK